MFNSPHSFSIPVMGTGFDEIMTIHAIVGKVGGEFAAIKR